MQSPAMGFDVFKLSHFPARSGQSARGLAQSMTQARSVGFVAISDRSWTAVALHRFSFRTRSHANHSIHDQGRHLPGRVPIK